MKKILTATIDAVEAVVLVGIAGTTAALTVQPLANSNYSLALFTGGLIGFAVLLVIVPFYKGNKLKVIRQLAKK